MKEKNKIKIVKITLSILSIIIILIALITLYRYSNKIELTQFAPQSESQMMGYKIVTSTGKVILIDGGTQKDSEQLKDSIEKTGRDTVDIWFLTHPHEDHVGAFIDIVENSNINIKKIYTSVNDMDWYEKNDAEVIEENRKFLQALENEKIKKVIQEPKINEQIRIDNVLIEILGIKNPEITNNAGNNSSMVIKINVNDKSILFLGDTGKESCEKLLKNQKNKLKSTIVQMSHHGQSGATEEFYKIVDPQICLWPTSEWLWNNDSGNRRKFRPLENQRN